jgi:hypothetical protein
VADARTVEVDDLTACPQHTDLHAVGVVHGAAIARGTDPPSCVVEHRSPDGLPLTAFPVAHTYAMQDLHHLASSAG